MKILIADDDGATRMMSSSLLTKFGFEVEECVNGKEALEALQAEDAPRLVLLDWMMPEMSGVDLIRQLHEQEGPKPYILLLTSRGQTTDKIEGLDAGADDYIVKPIEPGELRARIHAGVRILDMQSRMDRQVKELRKALDQIQTLHGILPICSFCKRIRDDKGYWEQVEVYVHQHSEADFSHSICPDCMQKHYPGLDMTDEMPD